MNRIEKIKEKFKEIFKEIFGKTKKQVAKKAAIGGTIAALGLTTACGTDKEAKVTDNPVKIEQDKDFKEQYKHDVESESKEKTIEQKVNELENAEDVLDFLKNMYIEQYETMTGDTNLTTEDIGLWCKQYLYAVYVNKETGEMIQYGSNYKQVEQKLEEEGILYDIEENVSVYKVTDTEKNVIDCVAIQYKDNGEVVPVKVTLNEQVGKPYTSILATMRTAIPYGLDYYESLEKGNENDIILSKRRFIKSLEDENTKQNQNATEEKTEENPEEGFEHE